MPVMSLETMSDELNALAKSTGLSGAMKLMFFIADDLSKKKKPLSGKLYMLPILQRYHNAFLQSHSEIELCLHLTLVLSWVRLDQFVDGEPSVVKDHLTSISKFMAEHALTLPKDFSAAVAKVVTKI